MRGGRNEAWAFGSFQRERVERERGLGRERKFWLVMGGVSGVRGGEMEKDDNS